MAVKSSELRSGIFVVLAMVVLTILIFSVGNFRTRLQPAVRTTVFGAALDRPGPFTYTRTRTVHTVSHRKL